VVVGGTWFLAVAAAELPTWQELGGWAIVLLGAGLLLWWRVRHRFARLRLP
jgi:hypothetical protein